MDLPVLAMIGRSGWVTRLMLIFLTGLSIVTWAIIFNRFAFFSGIAKSNTRFRRRFESAKSIADLDKSDDSTASSPLNRLGVASAREFKRILGDASSHSGVKDWGFFLQTQFAMAAEQFEGIFMNLSGTFDRGLILLAIASSIGPLIGLLGTVWGIMNSFYEIGNQGSASLPVVAPGIAEALITTILGLMVAIPALFFYNYFIHKVERVEDELDEFKSVILSRLKRETFQTFYGEKNPGSGAL